MSSSTDSPPKKKSKAETPYDLFFEEFNAVIEKNNGLGSMLVRGIAKDHDEDEEEEEDTSKYTKEQMENLRFIIVTQERADILEEMDKLILGDQYGDSFMMFNTSFSYHVLGTWEMIKAKLNKTTSLPKKFNLLLGYTNSLKEWDVWMHDHEVGWGGEVFLDELAKRWKVVLNKSNEQLGIDAEYTRPGITCFLEQFKKRVESIDEDYDHAEQIQFNFQ